MGEGESRHCRRGERRRYRRGSASIIGGASTGDAGGGDSKRDRRPPPPRPLLPPPLTPPQSLPLQRMLHATFIRRQRLRRTQHHVRPHIRIFSNHHHYRPPYRRRRHRYTRVGYAGRRPKKQGYVPEETQSTTDEPVGGGTGHCRRRREMIGGVKQVSVRWVRWMRKAT